jgi:hypothetical protein
MGEYEVHKRLMKSPLENQLLGKPRRKEEGNSNMDLTHIGCEDGRWM